MLNCDCLVFVDMNSNIATPAIALTEFLYCKLIYQAIILLDKTKLHRNEEILREERKKTLCEVNNIFFILNF